MRRYEKEALSKTDMARVFPGLPDSCGGNREILWQYKRSTGWTIVHIRKLRQSGD